MNRNSIPFLLPIRCLLFAVVFFIGAAFTGKALTDISNWWTVVAVVTYPVGIGGMYLAAVLMVLGTSFVPGMYESMLGQLS